MADEPTIHDLRERFRVRPLHGVVNLAGYSTDDTPFIDSKSDAKDALEDDLPERLFDAHELLFAEADRSLLLILQGTDCSGKNGTIKHVVIHMNPAGVRTASFTEPTEEEKEHHFLWRYRRSLPGPGQLGVFDRSHYEDVLEPQVSGRLDDDAIAERIDEINQFEREIVDGGTVIVKCLLHISYDEQRERFLRRLRRDDKRWKFASDDIETRRRWNEYQMAYGDAVVATNTDHAPWYIIPADHKWYRNWSIAHLLLGTLDEMGLAYPQPDFDLEKLRDQLEPPH